MEKWGRKVKNVAKEVIFVNNSRPLSEMLNKRGELVSFVFYYGMLRRKTSVNHTNHYTFTERFTECYGK